MSEIRTIVRFLSRKKARYFERRIAVYPVVGGVVAYVLRHFGKVFGGDAEGVGIVRHLAVPPVVAVLEHSEEAVQFSMTQI